MEEAPHERLCCYFVAVPGPMTGPGLPRVERLTTASACLIDQLPADDTRFATPQDALTACAPLPADARLYALLVPVAHLPAILADIHTGQAHEPVLLPRVTDPTPTGDDRAHALATTPGGRELGWEVLGYDCGWLHSWLCNDLHHDAVRDLDIRTDARDLLPDHPTAARLATWANTRTDTKPVTWFPASLIEWDIPAAYRSPPDPPSPQHR
ncbi:hypothetical protein [Kitasatospora sp. CB01950]|uniref:hypothetical protein n=1 Tax=Kitasatospora sp. CB01950 TaxID=1703930 RepID=UPI00093B12D6|nr:hypothetical protein [Kitasatospora sp. CB01950]OKJ03283.1 hypothetical protein AMK19_26670 [Kitasatospora sp. CB01950]